MPYGFSSAAGQQLSLKPSGREGNCELFLQGKCKSLLLHRDQIRDGGELSAIRELLEVCGTSSPKGKKNHPLTIECFLPSRSEMALEKINTLLPPNVLHAVVSFC